MNGDQRVITADISTLLEEARQTIGTPNQAYHDVLTTVESLKQAYKELRIVRAKFNERRLDTKQRIVGYAKGLVGGREKQEEYIQEHVENAARECKNLLRKALDQSRTAGEVTLQLRNKEYEKAQKAIGAWKKLNAAMKERESMITGLNSEAAALIERSYTGQDGTIDEQIMGVESRVFSHQEEMDMCRYTMADLQVVVTESKANHDIYARQLGVLGTIRKGASKAFGEAAQDYAEKRMLGKNGMNYDGLLTNLEQALRGLERNKTNEAEKTEINAHINNLSRESKYNTVLGRSADMESEIMKIEKELRQSRFNGIGNVAYTPRAAVAVQ